MAWLFGTPSAISLCKDTNAGQANLSFTLCRECVMAIDRSPCLKCDRADKPKAACAGSCEKLDKFKEELPYFSLWRGDPSEYSIPGIERAPIHQYSD